MNSTPPAEDDLTRAVSAQTLYDRSRAAGIELVKHFSTLATAAVGVFFVALSTKIDPPLTPGQRGAVLIALGAMMLTLMGAVLGWFVDALFYEYWARYVSGKDPESSWRIRERANFWRKFLMHSAMVFFLFGVLAAAYYVYLRLAYS